MLNIKNVTPVGVKVLSPLLCNACYYNRSLVSALKQAILDIQIGIEGKYMEPSRR